MIYFKSWRSWFFLIYMLLIIFISTRPGDDISWFFKLWQYDKIIHFIEYFGFGFLFVNALKIKPISNREWKYILLFILVFPIIDELLQYYSPKRIPDLYDLIADILGGLIGAYIRRYL